MERRRNLVGMCYHVSQTQLSSGMSRDSLLTLILAFYYDIVVFVLMKFL